MYVFCHYLCTNISGLMVDVTLGFVITCCYNHFNSTRVGLLAGIRVFFIAMTETGLLFTPNALEIINAT